jgi:hypothetical protein
MTALSHPLFGTIDPASGTEWEATLTFAGRSVQVELTLEGGALPAELVPATLGRIDDVAALDASARAALRRDLDDNDESAVGLYTYHHLEELPDAALLALFGKVDREKLDADGFLAKLALVRIGIYPNSAKRCLVCDYSLGAEHTNYVLAVAFDVAGQVSEVEMES